MIDESRKRNIINFMSIKIIAFLLCLLLLSSCFGTIRGFHDRFANRYPYNYSIISTKHNLKSIFDRPEPSSREKILTRLFFNPIFGIIDLPLGLFFDILFIPYDIVRYIVVISSSKKREIDFCFD